MKLLSLLIFTVGIVYGQDDLEKAISDIYGDSKNVSRNPFENLVEVTSPPPGSITALERCGEGSDEGIHMCVEYFRCDGVTKMIIKEGRTDGFGLIDIRFGQNSCDHPLDVCCGIPRDPGTREPSVSPSPPPVSPPTASTTSTTSAPPTPVTPRPSSVQCGIRNNNGIDFKITGDKDNEAEYGEFPWMVAILKTNYNPSVDKTLAICGGSLIALNVVLTGAHCVAKLNTAEYKVRAGEWDTQTEKERLPYQERTVSQVIIHSDFNPQVLTHNVALLILSSPFDQADHIGTICLPRQNEVSSSRNCLASGWGKDIFGKEGNFQVILKKIELPMVERTACQQALRKTRLGPEFNLHRSFVCAGGEAGKDTCTGDGGSPLVCPDPRIPGRYVQTGVVSWGIGCGEENIPGVYANVAYFRNWVDDKLAGLNIKVDTL